MQIHNIDLIKKNIHDFSNIVNKCKEIINENLQINGGTLKISNIFEKDYVWTNLIIAVVGEQIVGFALVRSSDNMHDLKSSNNYYYLSDIVVKKEFRNQGIGKQLMSEAIACTGDVPLVASALNDNLESIKLLSKFMTCYGSSKSGKYQRFVDNKHYDILYGNTEDESLGTEPHSKSR